MALKWPAAPDEWLEKIEPFSEVTLNDRTYKVPSVKFLDFMYGDDWRIPKAHFKPQHADVEGRDVYKNMGRIWC